MTKKQPKRLYTRNRGGVDRYYADFRDYADVGGRQEALIAPGEKRATTDPDVAAKLLGERLGELERLRRGRGLTGLSTRSSGLGEFARDHLVKKAAGISKGLITEQWVAVAELHLRAAVEFFGVDKPVAEISVEDVQRYVRFLEEKPTRRRAGKLSAGSQRKYLNSLSNLFVRAQSEGLVAPGYNPVASLMEKPVTDRREASWLEVPQATLLLESARTYRPRREHSASGVLYEVVATFLLTGGREDEVLGLDVQDVDFDRRIVKFRPNQWRRLKTKTSHRIVPLWPQLEEVLRPYVFGRPKPLTGLLFPSKRTSRMITDLTPSVTALGSPPAKSEPGFSATHTVRRGCRRSTVATPFRPGR